MGTLFVDNLKHQSSQGSGTITIGASGETIALASGATTRVGTHRLLASTTVSTAVSNVEFDSTVMGDYKAYLLTLSKVSAATDGWDLDVQFFNDSTSIHCHHVHNYKSMVSSANQGVAYVDGAHRVVQDGEASDDKCSGMVWIILNNDKRTEGGGVFGFGTTLNQNGTYYGYDAQSIFTQDNVLNRIIILDSAGSNIDSGTFKLYGIHD